MSCTIKVYDWEGRLTGFRDDGGTFVPNDSRNANYASAAANAVDPIIEQVVRVIGPSSGKLIGYRCEVGFVPTEPSNALYQLIERSIRDGNCEVKDAADDPPLQEGERVAAIGLLPKN